MSGLRDEGGSAFPVIHCIDGNWQKEPSPEHTGMSLRDYFAAKALQGICASGPTSDWTDARIAHDAYALADAMLKARQS